MEMNQLMLGMNDEEKEPKRGRRLKYASILSNLLAIAFNENFICIDGWLMPIKSTIKSK